MLQSGQKINTTCLAEYFFFCFFLETENTNDNKTPLGIRGNGQTCTLQSQKFDPFGLDQRKTKQCMVMLVPNTCQKKKERKTPYD